jgi:hypothetical protein
LSILLFLNELSCATPQPQPRVDEAMERFVRLLIRIRQWRSDAALVTAIKREHLELAPNYYVGQWIAARPRHVDLWRAIRSMQNRAPFSDVLPPGVGEGADYFWDGHAAKALAAAHLLDGLLVSLLADDVWDAPWIQADRQQLAETPDGEADVVEDSVEVRHAATLEHAASHEDWIKQAGLPDLRSGSEIWEARGDLFPNLQFLPRVRDQLYELRQDWIIPAAYELRRIDDAIAGWDPRLRSLPVWRSLVTPEHEMRKPLCRFTDLDVAERIFDLHGRFTPGPGRLYFRLVPEERKARIAHIGLKLGI